MSAPAPRFCGFNSRVVPDPAISMSCEESTTRNLLKARGNEFLIWTQKPVFAAPIPYDKGQWKPKCQGEIDMRPEEIRYPTLIGRYHVSTSKSRGLFSKRSNPQLLCRAGFPFVEKYPVWDQNKNNFEFENVFPVPMFVNEAFVSRYLGKASGVWIETSSPGLKGQSGGPLLDRHGYVCGMQVNTKSYPLNFKGTENQFLHVGRAVHVASIRKALYDFKIRFYQGGNQ